MVLHQNIYSQLFPHIGSRQRSFGGYVPPEQQPVGAGALGGQPPIQQPTVVGGGQPQPTIQGMPMQAPVTGEPIVPNQQPQPQGYAQPALPIDDSLADKMATGASGGSHPSAYQFPVAQPQMTGAIPEMAPSGEKMGMNEFVTGVAPRSAIPPEEAIKAVQYWQQELDNPQNRDKGARGLLKEILENFFYGLSQHQPGMNVMQTLALGGAGAGAGFLNKGWNEQRRAERELPRAQQRVDFEAQQAQRQSQIANSENQMLNRNRQTAIEADEAIWKKIDAGKKSVIDRWKDLPEFDPVKDPTHKALADEATKAGVQLPTKKGGERFTANIAPDGRVIVTNTSTGEYKVGNENLSKPAVFKDDEIADVEFGLYDEKQLDNMAEAGLTEGMKTRTVRPEIVASLPDKFKNEDGTFNEAAFFEARNRGRTDLSITDIYAEMPSDSKQRKAAKIEQLRKSQGGLRKQVTRFRSALNHRTPNPNAEPMTLDEVKQAFKTVLNSGKPKDLDEFFTILKSLNIR